jgi:hypothetical protein
MSLLESLSFCGRQKYKTAKERCAQSETSALGCHVEKPDFVTERLFKDRTRSEGIIAALM